MQIKNKPVVLMNYIDKHKTKQWSAATSPSGQIDHTIKGVYTLYKPDILSVTLLSLPQTKISGY